MNARTSKSAHRKRHSGVSLLPAPKSSQESSEPAPAELPPGSNSIVGRTAVFMEPEQRRAMIAEAAYYRAERRGFEPGHELEDWCGAEGEIDGMLTRGEIPLACGI